MSDRLTSITTGSGDDGTTRVVGPDKLAKDSPRIEAIGAVDELNASLGVALAELPEDSELRATLARTQHELFDLGGELAMPGTAIVGPEAIARIEAAQAAWNASLPPLQNFLLPGGSRSVATLQLARTVCRRAERRLVTLGAAADDLNPDARVYLNRLSDLLFVAGRIRARELGEAETLWEQAPKPATD
ncbi:MAG: cob(I)yrinic acid a,c-diamide adenosyltransferase [Pseudomonadota bacterium]